MATRRGGGRARLRKSLGLAAGQPLQTFPGLRVLQAGWEGALSRPPHRVACGASRTRPERRVRAGEGCSHRPGDPGTTRLSLDPAAKLTDAGAWQVARVGAPMSPLPATHTGPGWERTA